MPQDHTQLVGKSMESSATAVRLFPHYAENGSLRSGSDEVANEITTDVVPEAEDAV